MKNSPLYRRLLSVVLALAMTVAVLTPVRLAKAAEEPAKNTKEELQLEQIDPGTLESRKQGELAQWTEIEPHSAAEVVRVSIVLDKASTLDAGFSVKGIAENPAAKAYREGLRADQDAMTAKIESVIGGKLDVQWNLTLAANIISANVRYGQINDIKAIDGIKDVFLENLYEPQEDVKADEPQNGSASYMIGSNITWANGYTGAGSKVAIIDTGVDIDHLSFSAEGLEYALQQNAEAKGLSYEEYVASLDLLTPEKIDAVKDQLNANIGSGAAAYRNTKVGFGYNYIDKNVTDIIHLNDSQGEHGSHVTGIAAGNRFVKVGDEFKEALKEVGTQGVAPDAQIVTMKVFGTGGGAYDSDYMSAIEDAVVLGCDSANLSLGSANPGFSFSGQYESILNSLVENGTVVAFSAGNSGMWYDTPYNTQMPYPYLYIDDVNYHTGGSPGSFTNSLTTASVDNAGQTGMPLIFGDRHVFYSQTSGYGNEPIATIAGQEYEYVLLDGPGVDDNNHVGQAGDDFFALGSEVVSGKVALCYRGTSSFFAKANAAVAQGAVAVVIINNTDGVINMNLTGYNYTAPAVSILKADGDAIKAASEKVTTEDGKEYYTGTMSIGADLEIQVPEKTDVVTVSSFSSYGTPQTLVLKPEILTPGGSIYSVWGANAGSSSPTQLHDQYEVMSGTSMASPQTAGMAAVMGQYIRENDLCEKTGLSARQLINSLLMSTAHPVFDADGEYWPVFRVGSGLGNVADATAAQSYILMNEDATMFPDTAKDGKVKAELGDDPEHTGEYSYSFTLYPLGEKKEFALSTDIFTQAIAGNAGYGMLQYTGTMLIGAEVTYEINGETIENALLVEADVNKDGTTDELDAQAILDYLTGALEEGAEFDDAAADVDGDGSISTLDARYILESAATPAIEITEPTEIKVNIKIDDQWKALLLNNYFTKGFFVEGYTYVKPMGDEEGVQDVTHSIPIFGFCGSWTDPSMLDRSSAVDEAYGTAKRPYIVGGTNYLALRYGDSTQNVTYMGNPYVVEDKFPADRLAMSSDTTIQAANYLNIRNAGTLGFAVQDEDGKVLFAQATPGQNISAYYYVNGGAWRNTSPKNYNIGKKLGSTGVAEDDVVTVGFYILPEYYGIVNAKNNGEVATTGGLDKDGLTAVLESGIVGDGAAIRYTVKIDDTAPVVKGAFRDLITGAISIQASDNNYIAYIGVLNKAGTVEYVGAVPEQTEPGQMVELPLETEGLDLPSEVTLLVGDYAGNEVAFKVKLGGDAAEDTNGGKFIGFTSANGSVGSGNRALELKPEELYYASASDFGGVDLFSPVNVNVKAAEYVDGYVFMAADDGWFYAAKIGELNEAVRVAKYSDTTASVYDMAFNYKNNKLYVLGVDNTIYTMGLITGKLEPVAKITPTGVTGSNTLINKLAIDDEGTFYVANYGGPSAARLFSFTLPEPEEEEPVSELGELVVGYDFESDPIEAGWAFIDSDADGYNWEYTTAASPAANDGVGQIQSASYQNGARTPDNWAVSPAIDLSGVDEATLSVYMKNYSTSFPDTVALYAGTSADIANMTQVKADFQPDTAWTQYTADLTAFAGEAEVYVAIRHYNCTDEWRVYADTVQVFGIVNEEPEPEPTEPEIEAISVDPIGLIGAYNYSYGGALAWDHNEDILYLAANWNASTDTDHNLFTVNTETGRGTKAGASGKTNPGRFYVCLNGLFIIPGGGHLITPTDIAEGLEVEPAALELLKGQSADVLPILTPWTLTNTDVTFESADPAVATVTEKGTVTGVSVGETIVTVTTDAEPHLTADVTVTVSEAPEADIRGIIWNENGKGMASHFKSNDTNNWEGLGEVGQLTWGALVDDTVYGSTDDTMYAFDADTYEVTTLGGIVSDWIPSDAAGLPADLPEAWGITGRVAGICYNGAYFEVLDPEAGNLNYWNLSSYYSADPMALIAYVGRLDYTDVNGDSHPNSAQYFMMTESGELWKFFLDQEGYLIREDYGPTHLNLTGVADVTNETWGSMVYDAEAEFLYVSLYNGDEVANLYAIDANEPTRNGLVGDFNKDVWPVVGLYQYEPATDLSLKVSPDKIVVYEGATAELNVKVKLGETNEFTVEFADPSIASYEDGVVTGLKEGETTLTVTTVDVNEAGEHLSVEVPVKVKGMKVVDAFIQAQVTNAKGTRFTTISLDGAFVSNKGVDAPGNVTSGARTGDIYMAGMGTQIVALDPDNEFGPATYSFDTATYAQYPAMDIANYPMFTDADGAADTHKALFTTSIGWLVTPDYYGWNMSSLIADMAGVCFGGTDTLDDGTAVYMYYILGADGTLYQMAVDYVNGRRSDPQAVANTGIVLADQSDASMAMLVTAKVDGAGEVDYDEVGIVVADNGTKNLWYIDFNAETEDDLVGLIGTVDAENVSGLIGTFDSLVTVDETEEPEPEPEVEGNVIAGFYFEEDPTDWTTVDADGDGYGWTWNQSIASWFSGTPDFNSMAYEGTGCYASASFINTVGALTPDNWTISPAIDLSEAADDAIVSLYAKGLDTSYAAEPFAIYAGTSTDTASMTQLGTFVSTGTYTQYQVSLADFVGESEVYIALRHFDITDMYILLVDQVEILDQLTTVEPEPEPELDGVYNFSFETEEEINSFTLVDADGDGNNWYKLSTADGNFTPKHGEALMTSASYMSAALTPDNWLVSPALDLSELSGATLSVWANGQDPDYVDEVFALYAGTTADTESMTMVAGPFTATANWTQYTADLADFAGEETVYVAVRHYNVTDMFRLNIDLLQILDPDDGGSISAPVHVRRSSDVKFPQTAADIALTRKAAVHSFEAPDLPAFLSGKTVKAEIGSGTAVMSSAAKTEFGEANVEMEKLAPEAAEANGGTNAIRGNVAIERPVIAPQTAGSTGAAANGTVTVELKESEAVTNGLITVQYDPELLTFLSASSEIDYVSFNEAEGVICFAYAQVEELPAGETLAQLTFSYEGDTIETELTATTMERNEDLDVKDDPEIIPIGSAAGEPAIVKGMSLELEGKLGIRLRVQAPEEAVKATLEFAGEFPETVEFELVRDADHGYNASADEFTLIYGKIAAKEMTCPLTLKVFDEAGNELPIEKATAIGEVEGTAYVAALADWAAYAAENASNANTINLAKAILNYGGAAQAYFNFNLENPANPNGYLAEETAGVEADPALDRVIPADAKTKVGYASMALNLEGDTELQIKFTKEVTAKCDGKDLEVKKSGSTYVVSIPGIASVDLDKMFTIEVSFGGNTVEFKSAALSWCNAALAGSTNEALLTMCKALYLYNEMAEIYFNKVD